MLRTIKSISRHHGAIFPALLILGIFAISLQARFYRLSVWHEYGEDRAFYNGEPLLVNSDGYYYLSLSQDLLDGTYDDRNELRYVPTPPLRPTPPPLISWVSASLAKTFNLSLNWVAFLLPPILGSLIIFPTYFLGKEYNGPVMGYAASLFSTLALPYVYRTSPGFFDTDCLIITLVLSLAYFSHCFTNTIIKRKLFLYGFFCIATIIIFFIWWDQAQNIVLLISSTYLAINFISIFRKKGAYGKKILLSSLLIVCLIFFIIIGGDYTASTIKKIIQNILYVTKKQTSLYPNIGLSISEQSPLNISKITDYTSHTVYIFILALSGLLGLIIRHRAKLIFIAIPAAIGALSFFGNRFLIFLTPILAFGLSFFVAELWNSSRKVLKWASLPLLALLTTTFHFESTYNLNVWPYSTASEINTLALLKKSTPPNAIIWTPWTKGYLIQYWTRRATLNDGGIHNGRLNYFIYQPLVEKSGRFAAHYTNFYTTHGLEGVRTLQQCTGLDERESLSLLEDMLSLPQIEAKSKFASLSFLEQCQIKERDDFLFPQQQKPIYLFLYKRMFGTAYWWHWFGTWDIAKQKGTHARYAFYQDIMFVAADQIIADWGNVQIDLNKGILKRLKKNHQLGTVYVKEKDLLTSKSFTDGSRILYIDKNENVAVWMDDILWDTLFNRLFVRHEYNESFLTPIHFDKYNDEIWRILPPQRGKNNMNQ